MESQLLADLPADRFEGTNVPIHVLLADDTEEEHFGCNWQETGGGSLIVQKNVLIDALGEETPVAFNIAMYPSGTWKKVWMDGVIFEPEDISIMAAQREAGRAQAKLQAQAAGLEAKGLVRGSPNGPRGI